MSPKLVKKKYEEVLDYGILKKDPHNLKSAILSYTNFGKTEEFIYDGNEKMPFHERHLLYQSILRNEFMDLIQRKTKRRFPTHLTF